MSDSDNSSASSKNVKKSTHGKRKRQLKRRVQKSSSSSGSGSASSPASASASVDIAEAATAAIVDSEHITMEISPPVSLPPSPPRAATPPPAVVIKTEPKTYSLEEILVTLNDSMDEAGRALDTSLGLVRVGGPTRCVIMCCTISTHSQAKAMIETMGVHSGWDELPDIELFERVLPCKTVLAPGGSTTRETIVLPALAECLSHAQLLTVNVQAYAIHNMRLFTKYGLASSTDRHYMTLTKTKPKVTVQTQKWRKQHTHRILFATDFQGMQQLATLPSTTCSQKFVEYVLNAVARTNRGARILLNTDMWTMDRQDKPVTGEELAEHPMIAPALRRRTEAEFNGIEVGVPYTLTTFVAAGTKARQELVQLRVWSVALILQNDIWIHAVHRAESWKDTLGMPPELVVLLSQSMKTLVIDGVVVNCATVGLRAIDPRVLIHLNESTKELENILQAYTALADNNVARALVMVRSTITVAAAAAGGPPRTGEWRVQAAGLLAADVVSRCLAIAPSGTVAAPVSEQDLAWLAQRGILRTCNTKAGMLYFPCTLPDIVGEMTTLIGGSDARCRPQRVAPIPSCHDRIQTVICKGNMTKSQVQLALALASPTAPPFVAVRGLPTSGKTLVAMAVAAQFNGGVLLLCATDGSAAAAAAGVTMPARPHKTSAKHATQGMVASSIFNDQRASSRQYGRRATDCADRQFSAWVPCCSPADVVTAIGLFRDFCTTKEITFAGRKFTAPVLLALLNAVHTIIVDDAAAWPIGLLLRYLMAMQTCVSTTGKTAFIHIIAMWNPVYKGLHTAIVTTASQTARAPFLRGDADCTDVEVPISETIARMYQGSMQGVQLVDLYPLFRCRESLKTEQLLYEPAIRNEILTVEAIMELTTSCPRLKYRNYCPPARAEVGELAAGLVQMQKLQREHTKQRAVAVADAAEDSDGSDDLIHSSEEDSREGQLSHDEGTGDDISVQGENPQAPPTRLASECLLTIDHNDPLNLFTLLANVFSDRKRNMVRVSRRAEYLDRSAGSPLVAVAIGKAWIAPLKVVKVATVPPQPAAAAAAAAATNMQAAITFIAHKAAARSHARIPPREAFEDNLCFGIGDTVRLTEAALEKKDISHGLPFSEFCCDAMRAGAVAMVQSISYFSPDLGPHTTAPLYFGTTHQEKAVPRGHTVQVRIRDQWCQFKRGLFERVTVATPADLLGARFPYGMLVVTDAGVAAAELTFYLQIFDELLILLP